jgi:hypothetical protein
MGRKVINKNNARCNFPIIATLVWWLVLDKIDAPGWAWGVIGTILVVGWVVIIIDVFTREELPEMK